jgi:hypothetical protein
LVEFFSLTQRFNAVDVGIQKGKPFKRFSLEMRFQPGSSRVLMREVATKSLLIHCAIVSPILPPLAQVLCQKFPPQLGLTREKPEFCLISAIFGIGTDKAKNILGLKHQPNH